MESKINSTNKKVDFVLNSNQVSTQTKNIKPEETYSTKLEDIVWRNVVIFTYLHGASAFALYLLFTGHVKLITIVFEYAYMMISAMGVTLGAHRLWSHNSYKAKWPLKLMLLFVNAMAFQNSVYEWARDHRVHHKYTDTNADPHNYNRGFFFAHMGWLLVKKHPDVKSKGAAIDMSDLKSDPLVMFQHKYYLIIMFFNCFLLPTFLLHMMGQSWSISWNCNVFRYILTSHIVWLVNSAAHKWGDKPIDNFIKPADNKIVAWLTTGEGWHNYHHVFPWDYKAAEFGHWGLNPSTIVLECFVKLGLAYDLKFVSKEMICKRASRTGDGTFDSIKYNDVSLINQEQADFKFDHNNMVWGWHDKDLPQNAKDLVTIRNKKE